MINQESINEPTYARNVYITQDVLEVNDLANCMDYIEK